MTIKPIISKYFDKYRILPIPVKAALWYTICSIVQKSLSFLVTPIFTRIMSKEDYGLYTVYNSWYWVVVVFATLNLHNGIFNNGMQDYKDSRDRYTSVLQSAGSAAAVICFFIYLPFRGFIEAHTGLNFFLCILMFLQALFTPALYLWQGRQRYEYKYRYMIIATLAIAVLRPITSAAAVILSHNKGAARVVSFAAFEILTGAFFYIYHIVKGKCIYDKSIWKGAISFAVPLIPHYLSQTFLSHLDKLMIDRFCGRESVAVYEIAYTVAMVTTFINTSINNSFIPWIYGCLEKREVKNISHICNRLIIIVGCINLLMTLFAKEIILIVGGASYIEAAYLIPVLGGSVFLMFLYSLFGDVEFYYKQTAYTMYGSLTACVINGVLNYFFIPLFGHQAAAYTTLTSYAALAFAHYFFVKRIEEKECLTNIFNYHFIFNLSAAAILLSILLRFLYYDDAIRYGIIVFCIAVIFIMRKRIKPYFLLIAKERQ